MIRIRKGLDVPVPGAPEQIVSVAPAPKTVALLAADYAGLKPNLLVREGDAVSLGQPVIEDKTTPGVVLTSPGSGVVIGVNRGAKRRFLSLTVQLAEKEDAPSFATCEVGQLSSARVADGLTTSGLWTAFRTRPYNRIPSPSTRPHSIFVTAMDTNPLAADPAPLIAAQAADFVHGLQVLTHLTDGPVFLCHRADSEPPGSDVPRVKPAAFTGPHPAGLPGTHIHFLDPVGPQKTVWHVGYQDVFAFGALFRTGRLNVDRIVSLAGPGVKKPRLLRTRLGACLDDLTVGELIEGDKRVISGSVLSGRSATPPCNFLGRYHSQISVLREERKREFLGWMAPGFKKFSVTRAFVAAWIGGARRDSVATTAAGGSFRAIVPIGTYEKVTPLDVLPTQLLRAIVVGDADQASALGCLELDEEDLALCTFVCPSKNNYGPLLRELLAQIEREG